MTPALVVAAINRCEQMLREMKSLSILYRGGNFAESVEREGGTDISAETVRNLLGLQDGVPAQCAPLERVSPTMGHIVRHMAYIVQEIGPMEDKLKRSRWIGFAAGAAVGAGAPSNYKATDTSTIWDLRTAVALASAADDPRHWMAHICLGYMQGYLWARGQGSIDDFRVMNDPNVKRPGSA